MSRYHRYLKKKKKLLSDERYWDLEKDLYARREQIRKEKAQYTTEKSKMSTSKSLIMFLFLNCTLIELFTGWATIKMLSIAFTTGAMIDFTPLVALIGSIVGEVIGYAIYALKSMKENTKDGIVYMQAQHSLEFNNFEEEGDNDIV